MYINIRTARPMRDPAKTLPVQGNSRHLPTPRQRLLLVHRERSGPLLLPPPVGGRSGLNSPNKRVQVCSHCNLPLKARNRERTIMDFNLAVAAKVIFAMFSTRAVGTLPLAQCGRETILAESLDNVCRTPFGLPNYEVVDTLYGIGCALLSIFNCLHKDVGMPT